MANINLTLDALCKFIEDNKNKINKKNISYLEKLSNEEAEYKINYVDTNKKATIFPLKARLDNILHSIAKKNNFVRYGVLSIVKSFPETDISFVSSIIALLIENFIKFKEAEQQEIIETFMRKIYKDVKEKYKEFNYNKLGWVSKEFYSHIKEFVIGRDTMRYIADYLNINILIIELFDDNIKYIGRETFVKYRKSLILVKHKEEHYEPVFCDTNSELINKLINTPMFVEKIDCNFNNKTEDNKFNVGNDDLEVKEEKMEKVIVSEENSFADLKDIGKRLGIKLTHIKNGKQGMKTKSDLIKEIMDVQI
jgi:hypothetical protein